jgi:peptide-methionine (S)-S-oxide reductase
MRSPVGKTISLILIIGFIAWTGVRTVGGRPPAIPRSPFPKPIVDEPLASAKGKETVVLAGGCFWGVQAVFEHLNGVNSAASGYSGGRIKSPSYEMVSSGLTGHAESVSVTFDPSQITFGQILMIFFSVAHDPTQLNRQGPIQARNIVPQYFIRTASKNTLRRRILRSSMPRRSIREK